MAKRTKQGTRAGRSTAPKARPTPPRSRATERRRNPIATPTGQWVAIGLIVVVVLIALAVTGIGSSDGNFVRRPGFHG